MAKIDVVSAGVSALQSAQSQVITDQLGAFYDAVVADQPVATGGLTQADVDAAVAAAQAVDAQALTDATTAAQASLAQVQAALDAMTAKDQSEEIAVAQVQASIQSVQAAFDAIKALLVPAAPVAQV